jgi:hypothetical protein
MVNEINGDYLVGRGGGGSGVVAPCMRGMRAVWGNLPPPALCKSFLGPLSHFFFFPTVRLLSRAAPQPNPPPPAVGSSIHTTHARARPPPPTPPLHACGERETMGAFGMLSLFLSPEAVPAAASVSPLAGGMSLSLRKCVHRTTPWRVAWACACPVALNIERRGGRAPQHGHTSPSPFTFPSNGPLSELAHTSERQTLAQTSAAPHTRVHSAGHLLLPGSACLKTDARHRALHRPSFLSFSLARSYTPRGHCPPPAHLLSARPPAWSSLRATYLMTWAWTRVSGNWAGEEENTARALAPPALLPARVFFFFKATRAAPAGQQTLLATPWPPENALTLTRKPDAHIKIIKPRPRRRRHRPRRAPPPGRRSVDRVLGRRDRRRRRPAPGPGLAARLLGQRGRG